MYICNRTIRLVIPNATLIFLEGLCGYVWVSQFTLITPEGKGGGGGLGDLVDDKTVLSSSLL